jgi:ribonuclease Z
VNYIKNATLLYHEATYLHNMQEKAQQRYHSTAFEAATIAKSACVNQLILGHFSSRYDDLNLFINEAEKVFENTQLALEGSIFEIKLNETVCC